jgi:hypothetical protein
MLYPTAAQSGKGAPDVMRTDVGWTAGFANLGYLQPLDGTAALEDADDFLPGPMSTAHPKCIPRTRDSRFTRLSSLVCVRLVP